MFLCICDYFFGIGSEKWNDILEEARSLVKGTLQPPEIPV